MNTTVLHRLLCAVAAASCLFAPAAIALSEATNTEPATNGPMAVTEVLQRSQLPPGFRISSFAAEPDVHQPISMATDARGRLWVAENFTYSEHPVYFHPDLRDRIVILEDSDNDGRADRRTVFWDKAERLTSIEVGDGGIWAICLPQLLFIPDANNDDVPDGPPEVILDGFDYQQARHTVANGLRWGPDGWLYGRHGILGYSPVGVPGTPAETRTVMNVGVWRFDPARRVFEVVANGTTNPWGMDWDARGEPFFINTVIGHLWHLIPGAHYRRMFGDDPNPRVYELIEQHADHVHWATGEVWTDVRRGVTDATLAAGGGHAHTGLLIYQGGQWPAEWNGKLLTINFHGRLLNVERLERQGSGFVGRREPDAFRFADPWFRGIDLLAAPDGGVFVSDWSDTGECHDNDGIHRTSGRIYKLTYGEAARGRSFDLTAFTDADLARLQSSDNGWLARQSQRLLAERHRRGQPLEQARSILQRLASTDTQEVTRLRALWTLHGIGGIEPSLLRRKLEGTEHERSWAVRLIEDARHRDPAAAALFNDWVASELEGFTRNETSALVRLTLSSLLQKLPLTQRPPLARALLTHVADAEDHNQPLMIWYGVEPLTTADPDFPRWIASASIPRVQRLAARRLAEDLDSAPHRINTLLTALAGTTNRTSCAAILDGLADGLAGRRKVPKPASWPVVEARLAQGADESLRARILDLNALFGDGRALDQIRVVALNDASDIPRRRAALEALIEARDGALRAVCEKTLPIRDLSATAAKGLALFDDLAIADRLIAEWPRLYGHERAPVMNALISRPPWAARLLDAMQEGRVSRTSLQAAHARQILRYGDDKLTQQLTSTWGVINDLDESARLEAMQHWRQRLTPQALAGANAFEGRRLFTQTCGACHRLYGEGGTLGVDLTGSGRQNLDYLLENILFPSAIVPAEFRQTTLALKDGRTLSGVVRSRGPQTVVLEMIGESATVGRADIAEESVSSLSLMPEGMFDTLTESQAIDLIAYLMSTSPPSNAGQ